MKNYNKILEAVNRGIQLALDDFDDEEQVQNVKSKQVQNRDYTKEYLDWQKLVDKLESETLSKQDILSYALILGFRKIDGINKKEFFNKYQVNILDLYNIKDLIKEGLIIDNGSNLFISYDKIYIENSILINFVGEQYGKKRLF